MCCDAVDGVELEVLDDFTGIDDTLIKGEIVSLSGEQALRYVRARKGMEDSTNISRMNRQEQFIEALFNKITSLAKSDDGFTVEFADAIDDYIVYDSTDQKMLDLLAKKDDYEFLGVRQIEGQSKAGEEYMEFYADEDAITELVIELFYLPA